MLRYDSCQTVVRLLGRLACVEISNLAMAAFVQSYGADPGSCSVRETQQLCEIVLWSYPGLKLVDRSGKDFDAPQPKYHLVVVSFRTFAAQLKPRQQLATSDVVALYFSAHWCPPCRRHMQ